METTMNTHFHPEPPPLSADAHLQTRNGGARTFGKSIRRGVRRTTIAMRRAWEMFGIWLVRRHAMREFRMLDDRMLADIGIARSEISALIHEMVRRGTLPRRDL
jgi:uncharacterized protein YjiS (DUF1127 family)